MPAQESSLNDFGLLIAYLVPGATVLLGFSQYSSTLRVWFTVVGPDVPTIGGFLYLTVASVAVGMIINAIRWIFLDSIHHYTGLAIPALNFTRLGRNVDAFRLLIKIHYQHYQFYSNMFIATALAFLCFKSKQGSFFSFGLLDLSVLTLETILFIASRDTLRKYYSRGQQLLGDKTR